MKLALVIAAFVAAAAAAAAGEYQPPRTPFGQPDLQGIWSSSSLTRLERPAVFKSLVVDLLEARAAPFLLPPDEVGSDESEWFDPDLSLAQVGDEFRTSWIIDPADGRLPYSEAGRSKLRASEPDLEGPERRPLNERCMSATVGPPMVNGIYNNNWQILQTPDHVVIHMESMHEVRIVRLRDRTPIPRALHPWAGDAVGRWEGDTLVVETTNFHPGQSRRRGGLADLYLSPDARVTERFTRTSAHQMLYQFEVEDPATFTQAWRGEMPLNATRGPMFEYACHEGNYSLPGILAGARRQEREAQAAPAAPP